MHAGSYTVKSRCPSGLVTRVFSARPPVSSMLGGHVRRRLSPQAASWGLRPVGDQDHGPLSGWLAERRLKKALPSSQRKRRPMQGQRPAGDSPPRPSEFPCPGESLPLRDVRFSPQIELRPEVSYYRSLDAPAFNGNFNAIPVIAPSRNYSVVGGMDLIWHF